MSTLTIRPNGMYQTCLSPSTGGQPNYTMIDEAVENSYYVFWQSPGGVNSGNFDLYEMQNHTSETGVINSVTIKARASAVYTGLIKLGFKIGSNVYTSTNTSLTPHIATYSATWTTNPATSAAWTWSEIDNIICLLYLSAYNLVYPAISKCTQYYIEVDYTPGVDVTVTVPNPATATAQMYEPAITTSLTISTPIATATAQMHVPDVRVMYEYLNEGDTLGITTSLNTTWIAQTFTPAESHRIKWVRLLLQRVSNPYMLTVSIRATSSDLPSGADLCSATYLTSGIPESPATAEWQKIVFTTGTELTASTKYAIVVRMSQTTPNGWIWRGDDAVGSPYAGGSYCVSTDSGANWTETDAATHDLMFEEGGDPPAYFDLPCAYITGSGNKCSISAGHTLTLPLAHVASSGYLAAYNALITLPCAQVAAAIPDTVLIRQLNHNIYEKPEYYPDTPELINHVYVVGQDKETKNFVFGEHSNTADAERLSIITTTMVTTEDDANTVAENMIDKQRIQVDLGNMTTPTNCGIELYDVVQITDTVANQSANKYRVKGYTFVYDPDNSTFIDKVELTGV